MPSVSKPIFSLTDFQAFFICFSISVTACCSIIQLRNKDCMDRHFARKLMHITNGPVYVLCWLLFPTDSTWGPYLASAVVITVTGTFVLVGLGLIRNSGLVQTVSRSGDPREILRGPMFYGIVHVLATVVYWRDRPAGIVSLMILCAGDGFADIVGRKFGGSNRLPWNRKKSFAGSAAFFAFSLLFCIPLGWLYISRGFWDVSLSIYVAKLIPVVTMCMVVESLNVPEGIDNITVFAAGAQFGKYIW
eukprot:279958_1